MYGIRLKPQAQHAQRGATTARDPEDEAGSTQYPGHKRVSENYMSFTEYNNNNMVSGSSNSSSLLSEKMLPNGSVLARSTYSRSTMLSDTLISQSEFFGKSTVRKEILSGSVFNRTVESRLITAHSHCSGSTRVPNVYVEEVGCGKVCHPVPLQEEAAEICGGKSAKATSHQL